MKNYYEDIGEVSLDLSDFIHTYRDLDSKVTRYPQSFDDFCEILSTYPALPKNLKEKYGLDTNNKVEEYVSRLLDFLNKYDWDGLIAYFYPTKYTIKKKAHTQRTFKVEYNNYKISDKKLRSGLIEGSVYIRIKDKKGNPQRYDYMVLSKVKLNKGGYIEAEYTFNKDLVEKSFSDPSFSPYCRLNQLYFERLQKEPEIIDWN